MRGRRSKRDVSLKLEDWEFELIEKAAWDFGTTDRDDLSLSLQKLPLADLRIASLVVVFFVD